MGLYFNLVMAKKTTLLAITLGSFMLYMTNKTNFGIKLISKQIKLFKAKNQ